MKKEFESLYEFQKVINVVKFKKLKNTKTYKPYFNLSFQYSKTRIFLIFVMFK